MYYHDVQGNPELGTEMMREHVMARADPADQPFLLSFLQTQMFSVYCDNCYDNCKQDGTETAPGEASGVGVSDTVCAV
jgi:hypothetical protein